jgi:hypothetical protein
MDDSHNAAIECDERFWEAASEKSLAEVWDNAEDDAYARLLEE